MWMDSISQLWMYCMLHFFGAGSQQRSTILTGRLKPGTCFQTIPFVLNTIVKSIDNDLYIGTSIQSKDLRIGMALKRALLELTKKYLGEKCI